MGEPQMVEKMERMKLERADTAKSYASIPKEGALLTGKQEHYLKRELLAQQVKFEINELSSPTALRRFGAPFMGDRGEVRPQDSELPLLRYIFVHHVRTFPFLDQAKEKEFWQDRVQTFLDLDDDYDSFDSEEEDDEADVDGITAEQKMRARQARLRAGAGEPQKPDVAELDKLMDGFLMRLRLVLSDVD